eukprot:5981532-Amphidinium_carterae.1
MGFVLRTTSLISWIPGMVGCGQELPFPTLPRVCTRSVSADTGIELSKGSIPRYTRLNKACLT